MQVKPLPHYVSSNISELDELSMKPRIQSIQTKSKQESNSAIPGLIYLFDLTLSTRQGQAFSLLLVGILLNCLLIPFESFGSTATISDAIYQATLDIFDPKSESDLKASNDQVWKLRLMSMGLIVSCTLYLNVAVGLVVDVIVSKMEQLKDGRGAIIEMDHTLVLGWCDHSLSFLREICLTNKNAGGGVVVILCERKKSEVLLEIETAIPHKEGTTILCSNGNPLLTADLLRVSAHLARSITVMPSNDHADISDANILRILLAINSLHSIKGHIVADVGDVDNNSLLQVVAGNVLETVDSHNIIGRLVVMCSRSPHLSKVYNAILGFEGNEFYFRHWSECVGLRFDQLAERFADAIPIGIKSKSGKVCIRPSIDRIIGHDDQIIVLAEDSDSYSPSASLDASPPSRIPKQTPSPPPKRILICGWHRDIRDILVLLDHLSSEETELHIVSEVPESTRIEQLRDEGLKLHTLRNLSIRHIIANTAIRRHMEKLRIPFYDSIMVLSDESTSVLSSDSHVLATVMMIRAIELSQRSHRSLDTANSGQFHTGRHVHCVAELLDLRTQATLKYNPIIGASSDYILSNDLISRILAMVSENRHVNTILDELLGDKGSTFDVVPGTRYCEAHDRLSFVQLSKRASAVYGEIVCGYVDTFVVAAPVVLNPPEKQRDRNWASLGIVILRLAMPKTRLTPHDPRVLMIKVLRAFRSTSRILHRQSISEINCPIDLGIDVTHVNHDDDGSDDETHSNAHQRLRNCSTSNSLLDGVIRARLARKLERNEFNRHAYNQRHEHAKPQHPKNPPKYPPRVKVKSSLIQQTIGQEVREIQALVDLLNSNALAPCKMIEGDDHEDLATALEIHDVPPPLQQWHQRLWYRADTFISTNKGQANLLVILCASLAFSLAPIVKAVWHTSYSESVFRVWTHMTDTGTQNHAVTHLQKAIAFTLSLIGFVYFAVVVAFVVDDIRETMKQLKLGRTQVVEFNHTLMLGWSDKSIPFLIEICLANESENGGIIVVLAEEDGEAMASAFESQCRDQKGTRVIFRRGNPLIASDLEMVSAHSAKSICIMGTLQDARKSDANVLRMILALNSLSELQGHVVADTSDIDNEPLLELVGGSNLDTIVSNDVMGRLMVMCSRSPGLAKVFDALLGFSGNEFYMKEWPSCNGIPFGQLAERFQDAVPLGYRDVRGRIHILPPMSRPMRSGEALLVLAEDDNTYKADTPVEIPATDAIKTKQESIDKPSKILLCGWRRDIRDMLRMINSLSQPGTVVYMLNEVPAHERTILLLEDGLDLHTLSNIKFVHVEGNTAIRRHVAQIHLNGFDSYMVLCDSARERDVLESDSHVLASVLLLRSVEMEQRKANAKKLLAKTAMNAQYQHRMTPCIAEILDPRTQKTIQENHQIGQSSDFVQTNELISRMLAMVSENRLVKLILNELLCEDGVALDVVPATRYCEAGATLSFYQLVKRAQFVGEIVLGYQNRNSLTPTVLNPIDKSVQHDWWGKMDLVIIHEGRREKYSKLLKSVCQAFYVELHRRRCREQLTSYSRVSENSSDDMVQEFESQNHTRGSIVSVGQRWANGHHGSSSRRKGQVLKIPSESRIFKAPTTSSRLRELWNMKEDINELAGNFSWG